MATTKPAAARKTTKATKATKATKTPTRRLEAKATTAATANAGIGVGTIVEHRFHDVRTQSDVTEVGIVVQITDDGAYVAPLSGAAVVPLDRLRAV